MITQETKEKNYHLFIKKISQLGIDTDKLNEMYGEAIKNASFTNINDHGNAYCGSFLEILLKTLTPYAVKLNELLPQSIYVNKDSLVKVCLLHQIAKSVRFVPNDNQWEIEKRNISFKYKEDNPPIRCGLHSLYMSQECGINFDIEEVEAMTINDRDLTDAQSRFHSSPMASIVRMASELTYIEINS